MFTPMEDLPDNVVGFTAQGKVHSDDYKDTLIPAIADLIERTGAARVLLVLGEEWEGYSLGAALEDAKLGAEDIRKWERFALVSDANWIEHVSKLFGWMIPGKVANYRLADLDDAKVWVAA